MFYIRFTHGASGSFRLAPTVTFLAKVRQEALAEMVRVGEVRLVDLVVEGDESEKVEEEVVGEEEDFVLVEEVEMEAVEAWVEEWPDTDDGF